MALSRSHPELLQLLLEPFGWVSVSMSVSTLAVAPKLILLWTTDRIPDAMYDPIQGDKLLPNTPVVVKLANGSVIGTATTDANGNFTWLPPYPMPSYSYFFALATNPDVVVANCTTDSSGNGYVPIPLPLSKITGKVFLGAIDLTCRRYTLLVI